MTIIDSGEIDAFVSGLKNNDFLLVAGNSYLGINEITRRTIVNTANAGKKVAYFSSENERELIEQLEIFYHIEKPENVTVFIPGSRKSEDIEIINKHSVAKMKAEIKKQLKNGIRYDLIIIECIDRTNDFIFDKQFMYSICRHIKNEMKDFQIPVIATSYYMEETYSSYRSQDIEDKLFYDVRDVVEFLMFIDDNSDPGSGSQDQLYPSQINIRVLDCRIKELDLSYLFSTEGHRVCKKEGKALELYKKAVAIGLNEADAASYATYWYNNEMEEDEDFDDMRFSQGDDDENSGYYAIKEGVC